jgi:hypothetical protein
LSVALFFNRLFGDRLNLGSTLSLFILELFKCFEILELFHISVVDLLHEIHLSHLDLDVLLVLLRLVLGRLFVLLLYFLGFFLLPLLLDDFCLLLGLFDYLDVRLGFFGILS